MSSRRNLAVLAAVVVLAGGFGCAPTPSLYTSAAGAFRVMIPGKPTLGQQNVPTQVGNVVLHSALVDRGGQGAYLVNYGDFPPTSVFPDKQLSLNESCQGMVKQMNCQIREQKPVTLGPHPGREVRFVGHPPGIVVEVTGIARVYLVGHRLYQIVMLSQTSSFDDARAIAFLDSFQLADGSSSPSSAPAAAPAQVTPPVQATAPVQVQATPPAPTPGGWGTPEDPDHDCQVHAEALTATITVPGTIHNLVMPPGKANAPRLLKPVSGDFFAEVRIASEVRPGDPPAPGSGLSFNGAGLLLWGDAGDFLRLESAAVLRGGQLNPYILLERHRTGAEPIKQSPPFAGGPVWLRMERRGNQVFTFYNTDGRNWVPLQTVEFTAPRMSIGVDAVNTSSVPFNARFDSYRVGKL